MRQFKIATVQMNALKDDLQHNLDVHLQYIEEAARDGCALVVFPELSVTAHYGDPAVTQFAQPSTGGHVHSLMAEQAKKHDIIIGYGYCEHARGTFYNTYSLMGPKELIGSQRKVHASLDEYLVFRMGQSFEVFDLGICRVATLICYDSNFSESWRVAALKGAEVILAPHAGRKGGHGRDVPTGEQLENLRLFREEMPGAWGTYCAENGVFCAYGNQCGFNGHSTHKGGAFIVDPHGKMIARGDLQLKDLMITAEIDPKSLKEARLAGGYTLRTRRPDVYDEITRKL